jgi:hypothetical protein
MTTDTRTQGKALVSAIERRLAAISSQQHALAVEKAHLVEQLTPLRLGILAPDTAVAQLKAKGLKLRGLSTAPAEDRTPRPVTLKAITSARPGVAPLRPAGPQPLRNTRVAL